MGFFIEAKCRICNFSTDFKYGGSRFDSSCHVPAINKTTLEFENIDYKLEKNTDNYFFYTSKELKGKNHGNVFNNFDLELNEFNNYCPNCKQHTFDFNVRLFI